MLYKEFVETEVFDGKQYCVGILDLVDEDGREIELDEEDCFGFEVIAAHESECLAGAVEVMLRTRQKKMVSREG